MNVIISRSSKPDKKYKATIDERKTVHFGKAGASDYTKNKSNNQKQAYISRHMTNEDWTKSGAETAGFYSKHLLWNKKTLKKSIKDLNNRFKHIDVKLK